MKTYLSIMLFLLLSFTCVCAQDGNTLSNPTVIPVGTEAFNFTSDRNTTGYTNNYTGRPTNDIFYKFTIDRRMEVTMSHCGSILSDTYISLLDASGKLLAYNDDYSGTDACSTSLHSYLKQELDAGTYYVVSEGYNNNGVIYTRISGVAVQIHGDTRQDAITAGTFGRSFEYSDTQNTDNYTSQHNGKTSNDVFYKFVLSRKMHVTMNHCGSVLGDTYMHLLDATGNTIVSNDDYSGDGRCSSSTMHAFIQRLLEPGTYYIVSEGYSSSGIITTNITGFASDDFNYPDIPIAYSAEPEEVGGIGGTFSVSATGAATYSIPIKIPQGVGGMQPSLAIAYNSQAGNGMVGWGCNLSGMSAITRGPKTMYHDGTAKALTFSADEAYYLDGKRLIYYSGIIGQEGTVYYLDSDPFTKVIVHGTYTVSTANMWFEVQSSTGQTYYYGNAIGARQNYTAGGLPRIYAWYLDYVEDPLGNYMNYTYSTWNYCMYPNAITYGNNKTGSTGLQNTVTFGYESRSNDPEPFVIEGVKGTMDRRLKTITSKTGSSVYRTYEFQYDTAGDASGTKYSRLTSIAEKNSTGKTLQPVKLNWSYLPSTDNSPFSPQVNAANVYPAVTFSEQQFIAGDFNGDGLTDVVGISPVEIPTGTNLWTSDTYAYIYWASLDSFGNVQFTTGKNYSLGGQIEIDDIKRYITSPPVIDFNGDGINELVVPDVYIDSHSKIVNFRLIGDITHPGMHYNLQRSSEMPVYATGDFNNDGKGDILFIEKGHKASKYPVSIVGFKSGISLYSVTFDLTLSSVPEKIFVSDFNGNGLEDMMVVYDGGYTIFWNQGNGITGTTFSDTKKTMGTNVSKVWMMRSGDFNGDGLMDILMNSTGKSSWYFALNNGDGTFTELKACTLGLYDQSFTSKDDSRFDCFIYDFDLDGKSDVVITKAMYNKESGIFQGSWGEFNKTYTYWMRSTGSTLTIVHSATSNRDEDAFSYRYLVGDFNGDGQMELMNYGYNCYSSSNANSTPTWRLYRNSSYDAARGKVTSVIGDYGNVTNITYASLANGGIYTKGTGSSYPVADYTLPLHVVKTVGTNNGAAGSMTTNYRYEGVKMHLQGKGLLGMSSVTAENVTLGTVSESGVKAWNASFYIPSVTYTKNTVNGNTAEINTTLTVVDKGSKKYFAYPSATTEKDLDGNTVTTTRQFNTTYGYMTQEKADYGNNMYRTVQYGNYILAGKSYHPQLITKIQKHADDTSIFTQKTEITYDASKGYKTKTVENYGSSLPLTTEFTYDTWGNVKTEKISGSEVSALTSNYDYDATKRFIAKTSTYPPSSIITYTYDIWGNVLTETGESDTSNKLTTRHTYDGWGNRLSTLFPDGTKRSYLSGWNVNSSKRFFTLTQATGEPWVKTWYDNQGREVLVETIGPKSMSIKEATTYNNKGLITQKKTETGNLTTTENYTYDARGRVLTQTSSAGRSVSYAYGNRTVSSTTNGKNYTQVYDPWGGVKSVTDPVSSIAYTYKSLGKPQKIVTGGATFTMTYYDTGKQKTLTDPNAGTITYTYDAAGRLKTQVDGKGITTKNTYDVWGRLASSTTDIVTTGYTYGYSGNGLLRLIKKQIGSNYIAYTYDNYGRTRTETRHIEGTGDLIFTYSYNSQGQLSSIAYPGPLTVNRSYDAYGNLQQVLAGTQVVWELTGITGTVNTTKLGGTLVSTETRNSQGLLSNLKTVKGNTTLHNMNFVFDGATGNLTSRTGMIPQAESFVYDAADRLITVRQNSSAIMGISYHANGNITSKTGAGSYTYDDRPHAVSMVSNNDGYISENNQTITYTTFDKVSSISETAGSSNYLLNVIYGPDRQRWKSTLKTNNAVTRTIVYAGDYETVTEGGVTKQLYYLSGNNGLVAVYVKQSGQSDKIYYAHKDHLGSVVKLTDKAGTEVFKAQYDAWGQRAVLNNTFKFHRGYTGHEHLDEFKLIDMNGRMYDPLLARFLSPDPFVQMPDFSQNFNRYTYCLNNPLIYTDPSGGLFVIDDIIFAACMGAMINLTIQGMSGNVDNVGSFLGAMGIGALSGAAGSFAGQAVAGALGTATTLGGSMANGFIAGASGGFTGGFIGGAGNAWMNGANFGTGMKQGLIGAGIGAVIGGGIGAISEGIQYQKQNSIFQKGCAGLGVNEGEPVPATDKFLLDAQKSWYKDAPMDKIKAFSVENVPEKYVKSLINNNANGVTIPLSQRGILSGNSLVYFNKATAFSSARQLFFTMGHEFIHVSQFAALAGQSSGILTRDFMSMLDFHAYSYGASLGASNLSSFTRDEILMWAKMYPQFQTMGFASFPWTSNHSFKYPF